MKKIISFVLILVLLVPMAVSCTNIPYSIVFIVDGKQYDCVFVNANDEIQLPEDPVKDGYRFLGWFLDDGEWTQPFNANMSDPISSNMIVYARFIDNSIVNKVTFEVDGNAYYQSTIEIKNNIELPEDPIKKGYIFQGWYRDKGTWNIPFTGDPISESDYYKDITVYAYFIENENIRNPIVKEFYWDESVTVQTRDSHSWAINTKDDIDISELYRIGYNKIKIEYEFYTTGGWSLFGGNVNINGYISSINSSDNSIHHFEEASSKNGKTIKGSVITNLDRLKYSNKLYFRTENGNYSETFTVSDLKIIVTVYYD